MKVRTLEKDKVNVITLGCSKNLVDSENMITQLKGNDFEVVHDSNDEDANVVIVNTCGFIDLAKEESINTILEYADHKNNGRIEKLYVTGCLSQRYKDNLEEEIPEVDAFFGTLELPALLEKFNADITQLQGKLNDAKARQRSIIVRHKTATSQLHARKHIHNDRMDELLFRFENAERKIDRVESEGEAMAMGRSRSLADEIADLEENDQVEQELSELKKRVSGADKKPAKKNESSKSEE